MKFISYILLLLTVCILTPSYAQELRCRVNVQYSDIGDADKELFQELNKTIEEFMNSQVWTNSKFDEIEKIEMNIMLKITKQHSSKSFSGTLQIQSSRPVYNSTYTTTILNHRDESFNFQYERGQAIEVSENNYISNLSSVLSFYAYLIIGLDHDTFSPLGGSQYFQKAQNIANAANAANESGWMTSEKRENRYWFIENILNSTYSGYRNALYIYHRQGLDNMSNNDSEARKKIIASFIELEKVYRIRPSAFLLNVFFIAKKNEIIQIFSEGTPDEKQQALALIKKLNPSNASEYDKNIK